MTKLADSPATEAAKKAVEADKKLLEQSRAEYASRTKGKPTPTQEENDLAVCGAHILEHEPDGSDPDPNVKSMEPAPKQSGYQTRQTHASPTSHSRTSE
jgi:hypothetical protein